MMVLQVISDHAIEFLTGITAILLAIYTGETYRLRRAAQQQNENTVKPYLAFHTASGESLSLENIGNGVVKSIAFSSDTKVNGQNLVGISAIGAGAKKGVYHFDKDAQGYWPIIRREMPKEFSLTYLDQLDNRYEAKFTNNEGYVGILEVYQKKVK